MGLKVEIISAGLVFKTNRKRGTGFSYPFSIFTAMKNIFFAGLCAVVLLCSFQREKTTTKTITFPSLDGLPITADWYEVKSDAPWILLCHQSRFSRGEYKETAVKLNKLGFNCLAIDQRSGMECNKIKNETAAAALAKNLPVEFLDAQQDIQAALDYLYMHNGNKTIIIFGSSYSASLALVEAASNFRVKAVIAFSPGEYFKDLNVTQNIKTLNKPAFITSAKNEAKSAGELNTNYENVNYEQFIPVADGDHGSKVLWEKNPAQKEYWEALTPFLEKLKK
jgi:dienelactone hydrolase